MLLNTRVMGLACFHLGGDQVLFILGYYLPGEVYSSSFSHLISLTCHAIQPVMLFTWGPLISKLPASIWLYKYNVLVSIVLIPGQAGSIPLPHLRASCPALPPTGQLFPLLWEQAMQNIVFLKLLRAHKPGN